MNEKVLDCSKVSLESIYSFSSFLLVQYTVVSGLNHQRVSSLVCMSSLFLSKQFLKTAVKVIS